MPTLGTLGSLVHLILMSVPLAWYLLEQSYLKEAGFERTKEVNTMLEAVNSLGAGDIRDSKESGFISLLILIPILVITSIGLVINLLLILASHMQSRLLMLPWIVYTFLLTLLFFGLGLYFTLHTALISSFSLLGVFTSTLLLLLGVLNSVAWCIVLLAFIGLSRVKRLVRVASSIRGSRAGASLRGRKQRQESEDTLRSTKSVSIHPEVTELRYSSSSEEPQWDTLSRGTSEAGMGFESEDEEGDGSEPPVPVFPGQASSEGSQWGQLVTKL